MDLISTYHTSLISENQALGDWAWNKLGRRRRGVDSIRNKTAQHSTALRGRRCEMRAKMLSVNEASVNLSHYHCFADHRCMFIFFIFSTINTIIDVSYVISYHY